MSDPEKDVEILALRHQLTAVERQLGAEKVRFAVEDRVFLAAPLAPLSRQAPAACGRWSDRTRCCLGVATW
ncbi:hypothetical protein ACIQ9Q_39030 [Streptomyces sp. NPDC094438]|uniref:hypothetical protein n=1 Tax=Streptomyces sp. NPDC094438 TaxID=3366061 RepID=UPI0038263359